jgi:hypothetical protein
MTRHIWNITIHRSELRKERWYLIVLIAGVLVPSFVSSAAEAQHNASHYFHSADLPPGTVGQGQLLRGGPLPGYFQPVEIQAPAGAQISMVMGGQFQPAEPAPVLAGMLIGQVYRFKVSRIPRREGYEVFPSIEVINRTYPPCGLEKHFPIPVQLTQEELEMALAGRFVTRVIYLEDPERALPVANEPGQQRYYEVLDNEDPLQVADRMGRPVAILRIGSRTPAYDAVSQRFHFASPPFLSLQRPGPLPGRRDGLEPTPEGADAQGNFPRLPLPVLQRTQQRRMSNSRFSVEVAP